MHITEVFQTIIESDVQDAWQQFEYKGVEYSVYKGDVNLRIESNFEEDRVVSDFKEDWANSHPDPSAYSSAYRICYGATFVAYVILVHVDGSRGILPLPEPGTKTPELLPFKVAEIVNCNQLHEYMKRAGFSYPEGA